MVRTYIRKTKRQQWSPHALKEAISEIDNNGLSINKASQQFAIPIGTLHRYLEKTRIDENFVIEKRLGRFTTVFTVEQENELVSYLTTMEAMLFGMTVRDLRNMAFQIAEKNGISHPFKDSTAGIDWAQGFLKRHPSLSLRTPEATSAARAMGFNKVVVNKFFQLLTEVVTKNHITPDRIYNCDETGFTVNPKALSKVIAQKGRRQVGAITSAERGQTVTAEICFSAAGVFVPPMLIFPRVRMQPDFEIGLPPSAFAICHESGWMTKELFLSWFNKFIHFTRASLSHKVLLLIDGHSTHTKNLELIELAEKNGVILLCFPPHCSHKLQPADVSFMKPLMSYYADETRKFLRSNPGKVVTLRQIAFLFGVSYIRATTMPTALNGFKKTGICPLDPDVFTDADYLPSATTNIVLLDSQDSDAATELPETTLTQHSATTSAFLVSAQNILPIPQVPAQSTTRVFRKRGATAIRTSSPYKKSLEDAEKARNVPKRQMKNKPNATNKTKSNRGRAKETAQKPGKANKRRKSARIAASSKDE